MKHIGDAAPTTRTPARAAQKDAAGATPESIPAAAAVPVTASPYRSTQRPWAWIPSAVLNFARKCSVAIVTASSTICGTE